MSKICVRNLKYAIPSSFTVCAMLAAYYSILHSASGTFTQAAYGVIIAMIFDSLDGRSARLTNTCTPFGASFDSLTDMMAYGVAPAIMMYCWGLYHLGKMGYLVCFIYCACAGLRLARFNVMSAVVDKRYFQGLSSTMAGGFMVAFVLACVQYGLYGQQTLIVALLVTLAVAGLMVSNLKFYSFKEIKHAPRLVTIYLIILLGLLICLTVKLKGLIVVAVLTAYIVINLFLQPWFRRS